MPRPVIWKPSQAPAECASARGRSDLRRDGGEGRTASLALARSFAATRRVCKMHRVKQPLNPPSPVAGRARGRGRPGSVRRIASSVPATYARVSPASWRIESRSAVCANTTSVETAKLGDGPSAPVCGDGCPRARRAVPRRSAAERRAHRRGPDEPSGCAAGASSLSPWRVDHLPRLQVPRRSRPASSSAAVSEKLLPRSRRRALRAPRRSPRSPPPTSRLADDHVDAPLDGRELARTTAAWV
jgi:hypothetical protein